MNAETGERLTPETLEETFDRLSVPTFIRPALTDALDAHVADRLDRDAALVRVEALAGEWEGYSAPSDSLLDQAQEEERRWCGRELSTVLHPYPSDPPDAEA